MNQGTARREGSVFGLGAIILMIAVVASVPTWVWLAAVIALGSARLSVSVRESARERKARQEPPPEGSLPLGESDRGMPVWLTRRQLAAHGRLWARPDPGSRRAF